MPLKISRLSLLHLEQSCTKLHHLSRAVVNTHCDHQRAQSTFGYHQAQSLVYSKHGEPNEVLDLHTYSIPPPHSTLITLRTLSSPVNPSDVNQIQGTYARLQPFTDTLSTPSPSAVPGNEGCFEVIATGSSVTTVAKGNWVIPRTPGLGTWRTHLQVDESSVMCVEKEGLMHGDAATVSINPLTAWRLLKDFVDLKEGDWFIQNGASSAVGRTVIQLAKLWGLRNIGIIRDPIHRDLVDLRKIELAQLGATKVFTESETRERRFKDMVMELTKGEEVRLGLNGVGGDQMAKMATLLSPGAQLVTYGNMSRSGLRLSSSLLIFRDLAFRGFWLTRWSEAHPKEREETVRKLLTLMRDSKLQPALVYDAVWQWDTPKEDLIKAVQMTFNSQRTGKRLFIFR